LKDIVFRRYYKKETMTLDGRNEAFQSSESIEPIASQNDSLFRSVRNTARLLTPAGQNLVNATKTHAKHA